MCIFDSLMSVSAQFGPFVGSIDIYIVFILDLVTESPALSQLPFFAQVHRHLLVELGLYIYIHMCTLILTEW